MIDFERDFIHPQQRKFTDAPGVVSGEQFSLVKSGEGCIWLLNRDGEGMAMSAAALDDLLAKHFAEHF